MAATKYYEHNGETHTLYEWAEITGIPKSTLRYRIDSGMDIADALTKPLESEHGRRGKYTYNGETHTLYEWGAIYGLRPSTISNRMNLYGWSLEEALTTPIQSEWKKSAQVYECGGESHTLSEWAEITGIQKDTLKYRIQERHWPIEQAISTPVNAKRTPPGVGQGTCPKKRHRAAKSPTSGCRGCKYAGQIGGAPYCDYAGMTGRTRLTMRDGEYYDRCPRALTGSC